MRVLYFDCFSGISGDMTLGALLDIGVSERQFRDELDKLDLRGYRLEISKKLKFGIAGTDVNIFLTDEEDTHHHNHRHKHHRHRLPRHRHHGHNNSQHVSDEEHHHGRNFDDIIELIENSRLKKKVKEFSKKVFTEIAQAEARVHGKSLHEVHFHEVGAVDSIVDIVGAAICLDLLDIDAVYSSPLYDGQGFVSCQHGIIPVPVPAVLEMLAGSDIPLIQTDAKTELVTPTGMGIIKCLAKGFGKMPPVKIIQAGFGMGKRDIGRLNALRVVMGEILDASHNHDEAVLLETNIDNISSEILGYTMERLLENGALDVFYTPVYMKKNRPAVLLSVLTGKSEEKKLVEILFKETTTLGIRRSTTDRYCMHRRTHEVETGLGKARIKIAFQDEITKAAPEYEDCARLARESGLPIREIYDMVLEAAKAKT